MHTNPNSAAIGKWTRAVWLAPLVVSLFGCGGSSDTTTDAAQNAAQNAGQEPAPAAAPATSTPEDLRGQWETILTYVPPFYSGPYGDIAQGDGSLGITFYFWPDGRYQHIWNLAQAYFGGNCFRSAGWDETGTLSGTGPEFTFNPGRATYSAVDSCGRTQLLDPAPVTAASHTLTLEHDDSGWPLLRMSFPTGDLVFEKCRRCQ